MTADEIKKLKDAGVEASVIDAAKGDDLSVKVATLEASVDAEKGKNSGILEDKKKFKARAETAESELKTIKEDGLDDDGKAKLELQRVMDLAEQQKTEIETMKTTQATKDRELSLNKIGGGFKFLDIVPDSMKISAVKEAFADIEDLGNKVLVEAKQKEFSESHKALLVADVAEGSGDKSGKPSDKSKTEKPTIGSNVEEAWSAK